MSYPIGGLPHRAPLLGFCYDGSGSSGSLLVGIGLTLCVLHSLTLCVLYSLTLCVLDIDYLLLTLHLLWLISLLLNNK